MDALRLGTEQALSLIAMSERMALRTMSYFDMQISDVRLVAYTTAAVLVVTYLWSFQTQEKNLWQRIKDSAFATARVTPIIGPMIQREVEKTMKSISDDPMFQPKPGEVFTTRLPEAGLAKADILQRLESMERVLGGADWRGGRVSGAVYFDSDALHDTLIEVYSKFAWSNPLHPDVFPAVRKMEGEVVRMVCDMYHGTAEACGCITSGGTESIMMACRVYRRLADERGVERPEIVAPVSVHSAFDKACDYFRMRLVRVPVDERTRQVDIRAMRRAVTGNTVLLVGSAPQYPHGIVDDIQAVAALGVQYSIGVHVDACLGGFLIPFLEDAGLAPLPLFDFRVRGVTSISADTHKFGFAPKGSSVVMYASHALRRRQYFVAPDWQGGIYASPSVAGSRPGGIIAACWAALMFAGREGYADSTRRICAAARTVADAARLTPGLFVFGEPRLAVVALGSRDFDIYRLGAALGRRGWNINSLQLPPAVHICCTMRHTAAGVTEEFVRDLQQCTAEIMREPLTKSTGMAAIYGMAQAIPDRSIVSELAHAFLDACVNSKAPETAERPRGDDTDESSGEVRANST